MSEVDETTFPLATWSRAVNYLQGCAVAVPVARPGLPIGIQFVTTAKREADLLVVAKGMERLTAARTL